MWQVWEYWSKQQWSVCHIKIMNYRQCQTIWSLCCRRVWLCFMWRLHIWWLIQMCRWPDAGGCSVGVRVMFVPSGPQTCGAAPLSGCWRWTAADACSYLQWGESEAENRPTNQHQSQRHRSAPDGTSFNKPRLTSCSPSCSVFIISIQEIFTCL